LYTCSVFFLSSSPVSNLPLLMFSIFFLKYVSFFSSSKRRNIVVIKTCIIYTSLLPLFPSSVQRWKNGFTGYRFAIGSFWISKPGYRRATTLQSARNGNVCSCILLIENNGVLPFSDRFDLQSPTENSFSPSLIWCVKYNYSVYAFYFCQFPACSCMTNETTLTSVVCREGI